MVGFKCIDISTLPTDMEGFYATNNQFQKSGPKGFIQVKVLENNNLYVRVDLPGVPDDAVHHRVDSVRQKVVFFSAETFNDGYEKEGVREYSGTAGLGCDCCEITGVNAKMKDGVLRMIVSRVKVKDNDKKCTHTVPPFTGKSGGRVEEHPFVVKGRKGAFVGEPIAGGGLYFAVDVPGVSVGDVQVLANDTEVKFTAVVKNVFEHDESGRLYLGSIDTDWSSSAPSLLSHAITGAVNFGVLKVLITPRRNTTTNKMSKADRSGGNSSQGSSDSSGGNSSQGSSDSSGGNSSQGSSDNRGMNRFQKSGSQAVYEAKETNTSLIYRIDLPGCSGTELTYWIEGNNVHFFADEPVKSEYDHGGRKYGGTMVFNPVGYKVKEAKAKLRNGVLWITVPKIPGKNLKRSVVVEKMLNCKITKDDVV